MTTKQLMAMLLKRVWLAIVGVLIVHFFVAGTGVISSTGLMASLVIHILTILCIRSTCRDKVKRILPAVACSAIVAFGSLAATRYVALSPIRDAREQFAFEPLDSRLAYESFGEAAAEIRPASIRSAESLEALDLSWRYGDRRTRKLQEIHSSYVERFAGTPGFGVGRMRYRQPLPIPQIDLKSIRPGDQSITDLRPSAAWPETIDSDGFRYTRDELKSPWVYYTLPLNEQVSGFDYHFAATKDFVNPATLGIVNDQREVAGFVEHGFHNQPPAMKHNEHVWFLKELKLVSLLQFGEPRVYQTESLPRMDEISSMTVPTRALEQFESESLAGLYSGEETRLLEKGNNLRMLGALRARGRCLECHNAKAGELLGAFTYTFQFAEPENETGSDEMLTQK